MKPFRVHITVFGVGVAVLLTAVFLDARTSRGQSKSAARQTPGVKRVIKSTGEPAAPTVRNALLKTELSWTFGSKPQRGWYLYKPLIDRLLNTKHDAGSEDFAKALARWQDKAGLLPNGVLDDDTLYAMIKFWQDNRLKDRSPAAPEQLLTAPVSDFYDPTRAEELRQVERETYAAYKRMISAALSTKSLGLAHGAKGELAPQEKYLKIISSFRSKQYQEKLRRESPGAGSAGLAVNSPHFTGRALDLYVGGDPVETRDSNRSIQVEGRVYQWLVKNADRFGFRPYCYEPWHWEYVGKK
ncbi:MAG TPA: D-alanyl-D-alanine carboxypeptidase family protein [Candidatus Polarisedimenticolaceae bacterium]|nr:D-alanyl-D-alanine carboxypeptidase family protein [Candidatus Polarisedimenticolaceae bacterium]